MGLNAGIPGPLGRPGVIRGWEGFMHSHAMVDSCGESNSNSAMLSP